MEGRTRDLEVEGWAVPLVPYGFHDFQNTYKKFSVTQIFIPHESWALGSSGITSSERRD